MADSARRWWRPGWAWTIDHEWISSAGFAVASLAIGGALGGGLTVIGGSWHDPQVRVQAWAAVAVAAFGILAAATAGIIVHGRKRLLARNGIAYILVEEAEEWSDDTSSDFLESVRDQFALSVSVPGPSALSHWHWPLGDGAEQWNAKAEELTRSFRALHQILREGRIYGHKTASGIFMWAWWAVAVGFGQRVTAADRGLVPDVWQRPSRGRAGQIEPLTRAQRPHRFGPISVARPGDSCPYTSTEHVWPAEVTIVNRQPGQDVHLPAEPPGLLVVRLGRQRWGPLPPVDDSPPRADGAQGAVSISLDNVSAPGIEGTFATEIHELRYVPPSGGTEFEWQFFPHLVGQIAEWICQKAADAGNRAILLGAVLPPELALGLGLTSGQQSQAEWPAHLWPIVFRKETKTLVVPNLDLGTARS